MAPETPDVVQPPGGAVEAVVQEDVVVGHRDEGHLAARRFEVLADRLEGRAALERAQAGLLDHDAVHHRIGERHADLDRVGAAEDGRFDVARPVGRQPGHEVGHERLSPVRRATSAKLRLQRLHCSPRIIARTCATSLSPRPERFSRTVRAPRESRRPTSRAIQATAWAVSRAGMMPSVSLRSRRASMHFVVADGVVLGARRSRRGARARDRCPDSRDRPRSSAPLRSDRTRLAACSERMPCRTPGEPLRTAAPPAASTPMSRASESAKPAKTPAAFEPPPTQATTTSGVPTPSSRSCAAASLADDALELADHPRERVGTHHRAEAVVRVGDARHPLAHRLVDRVLEGARARGHGHDASRRGAPCERR